MQQLAAHIVSLRFLLEPDRQPRRPLPGVAECEQSPTAERDVVRLLRRRRVLQHRRGDGRQKKRRPHPQRPEQRIPRLAFAATPTPQWTGLVVRRSDRDAGGRRRERNLPGVGAQRHALGVDADARDQAALGGLDHRRFVARFSGAALGVRRINLELELIDRRLRRARSQRRHARIRVVALVRRQIHLPAGAALHDLVDRVLAVAAEVPRDRVNSAERPLAAQAPRAGRIRAGPQTGLCAAEQVPAKRQKDLVAAPRRRAQVDQPQKPVDRGFGTPQAADVGKRGHVVG